MNTNARVRTRDVTAGSWRGSGSRHTLLIQMAKEAEALAAQAQRLRELKKMGRVTVPRIAKAVDVSERQVQRWLAGDSDIDGDNLKKLARYLGTTPDYIEYGTARRQQQPTPELFPAAVPEGTAAKRVMAKLEAIEEQLALIRAENQVLAAEVRRQIERASTPTRETRQRRRA